MSTLEFRMWAGCAFFVVLSLALAVSRGGAS